MDKILFITPRLSKKSGGGNFTNNIISILSDNFELKIYYLNEQKSKLKKLLLVLNGFTHGLIFKDLKNINRIITKENIGLVFINHSYYGILAKYLKKTNPNITIVTFFHNIERNFVWDVVRRKKGIGNYLTFLATCHNEKLIIKYSDKIVGLNDRDDGQLYGYYHCHFNIIIPIFIRDTYTSVTALQDIILPDKFCLFVGSLFSANYEGIKWFARNVAPYISIPLVVVGKGFERLKDEFREIPNLIIIGEVNNLIPIYNRAHFIVSPIFDGSGMKTKTAEALMCGKYIIGTTEAFQGYNNIEKNGFGIICNSPNEFIQSINSYSKPIFNIKIREYFLKNFSLEAVGQRLVIFCKKQIKY